MEKEEKAEDTKAFTAMITESIRSLVELIHEYKIPREDLVTIIKDEKEGYVVFCYTTKV